MSVHLRGGVADRVARGTLRDAGTVVDDVFVAVRALFLLAPVVQILAEGEGDAAPAFVGEVVFWAALHTAVLVQEATAGHAVPGRIGPQAAAQTLVVAAVVVLGAGSVCAVNRTHCVEREETFSLDRAGQGEILDLAGHKCECVIILV